MDPGVVAEIDARLAHTEIEHRVTVPWAIESGSRAWGFPSPDSDYDCRFIFVRGADDYLTLWPKRDVIETPLDKIFDVNGWDLAKAVRLVVKGNVVVTEWLRSPIIYSGSSAFRDGLLSLAAHVANPALIGRHYLHVGRDQWPGDGEVLLKRLFYALRPAASLRWLRVNSGQVTPPMDLPTLLAECDPPSAVVDETTELTALKAVTRELGVGSAPAAIARFIAEEFELATSLYEDAYFEPTLDVAAAADEYFRSALAEFGPR